jgi:hypothetical protein
MLRIFVLTLAMIFITAVFCADPCTRPGHQDLGLGCRR